MFVITPSISRRPKAATSRNDGAVVGQVGNLRRVGNPPEPLLNRPAGAGCQPARRIPSCPTINAGFSASRKLSGIGHECLPHLRSGEGYHMLGLLTLQVRVGIVIETTLGKPLRQRSQILTHYVLVKLRKHAALLDRKSVV